MRKAMVEPRHTELSVRAHCNLLSVNRNRLKPKTRRNEELDLNNMNLLDRYHLDDPPQVHAGCRTIFEGKLVCTLADDGFEA
ncbi:hypothetical protein P0Y35_03925 [Kiritimatiellaeota bacterium B1221]|nr:hypothetical protein [Kiritimatiellaeota bacterium B1221]